MMTKYIFDTDEIECRFSPGQIKHYMRENKFTKLECLFYLWAFNNFGTNSDEVSTDLGRPMYRKLARRLGDLFELCSSRINVANNVANNVAKPNLQHLQAENNRLREALLDIIDLNPYYLGTEIFGECVRIAEKALNGESEEK